MNTITKAKKTKYNANINIACIICQAVLSTTPMLNTGPPGIATAALSSADCIASIVSLTCMYRKYIHKIIKTHFKTGHAQATK